MHRSRLEQRAQPRSRSCLPLAALVGAAACLMAGVSPAGAAGVSVDLDQWANLARQWQNGDLNGNNTRIPEGGVIPFRLAIENLAPGPHAITISYDFTASGHKAYDFLATGNATSSPGLCVPSGGAISSMCPSLPAPSTYPFPSDPYVANGVTVRGAEAWSGVGRRLTIYGGTITSISGPSHAGSVDGNSSASVIVRFRSTGAAVLLAWGGHLAQSSYWDVAGGGARDGASLVSGAPWHMRTLGLDGGGNRNQDRSIQPSAVVGELPPAGGTPTPPPGASVPRPTAPPRAGGGVGQPPGMTPPATTTLADALTGRADGAILSVSAALAGLSGGAWLARRRRPPAGRPAPGTGSD